MPHLSLRSVQAGSGQVTGSLGCAPMSASPASFSTRTCAQFTAGQSAHSLGARAMDFVAKHRLNSVTTQYDTALVHGAEASVASVRVQLFAACYTSARQLLHAFNCSPSQHAMVVNMPREAALQHTQSASSESKRGINQFVWIPLTLNAASVGAPTARYTPCLHSMLASLHTAQISAAACTCTHNTNAHVSPASF